MHHSTTSVKSSYLCLILLWKRQRLITFPPKSVPINLHCAIWATAPFVLSGARTSPRSHIFTNAPAFSSSDTLLGVFRIHWKSPLPLASLLHRSQRCPRDSTLRLPRLPAQITLSDSCSCAGCIKYLTLVHAQTGTHWRTDTQLISGDKLPRQTVCSERNKT